MKDQHSIDQLFRQKLSQRSVPPAPGDWAAMEQLLSNARKPWWKKFGFLFSVVLFVGAASWATYHWTCSEKVATIASEAHAEQPSPDAYETNTTPHSTATESSAVEPASADVNDAQATESSSASQDISSAFVQSRFAGAKSNTGEGLEEGKEHSRAPKAMVDRGSKGNAMAKTVKGEKEHSAALLEKESSFKQNTERTSALSEAQQPSYDYTSYTTSTQSTAQGGILATAGERASMRAGLAANSSSEVSSAASSIEEIVQEKAAVAPIALRSTAWPALNSFSLEPHQTSLPVCIPSWSVRASAGWLSMQRSLNGSNAAYISQRSNQERVFPGFTAQVEAEKQWHRWSFRAGVGMEKWHEEANYRGTVIRDSVVTVSAYEYFTYIDSIFQNGAIVYITVTDSLLITTQDTVQTALDNKALRAASGRIDWSVFSVPISLSYRMPGMPLGGTWRLDAGIRFEYAAARSGSYLASNQSETASVSAGGFSKTSYSISIGAEWRRSLPNSAWYIFLHPQWRYGITSWNADYTQRYQRWALQAGIGFQLPVCK